MNFTRVVFRLVASMEGNWKDQPGLVATMISKQLVSHASSSVVGELMGLASLGSHFFTIETPSNLGVALYVFFIVLWEPEGLVAVERNAVTCYSMRFHGHRSSDHHHHSGQPMTITMIYLPWLVTTISGNHHSLAIINHRHGPANLLIVDSHTSSNP